MTLFVHSKPTLHFYSSQENFNNTKSPKKKDKVCHYLVLNLVKRESFENVCDV